MPLRLPTMQLLVHAGWQASSRCHTTNWQQPWQHPGTGCPWPVGSSSWPIGSCSWPTWVVRVWPHCQALKRWHVQWVKCAVKAICMQAVAHVMRCVVSRRTARAPLASGGTARLLIRVDGCLLRGASVPQVNLLRSRVRCHCHCPCQCHCALRYVIGYLAACCAAVWSALPCVASPPAANLHIASGCCAALPQVAAHMPRRSKACSPTHPTP